MIQILSALSAGTEQNPLVASSGEATSASFVALFAQALSQGAGGGKAGNPMLSALPGHKGLPALASDGSLVVDAKQAGGDASAEAAASFMSMFGLPVPGIETAAKVIEAAKPAKGVATAGPVSDAPADAVSDAVAVSEALAGLVSGSQAGVASGVAAVPTDTDGTVQTAAQDMAAAPAVALTADTENGRTGKKLPNQRAVIAGQQKMDLIRAQSDMAKMETTKPDPLATETIGDDPKLSALNTPSASQAVAAPASTTTAAVATPVSGQEAALLAVRGHAESGQSGKVVAGMQSGFGTPAWQQELGDKVVWLVGRHSQMAELVLNPPSLGAVEVRLNMSGQDASAQFFAANPHVRDALEAALPRLRELMLGAGISLGEATVSDQSFGQRDKAESGWATGQGDLSSLSSSEDGQSIQTVRMTGTSLLDYFA